MKGENKLMMVLSIGLFGIVILGYSDSFRPKQPAVKDPNWGPHPIGVELGTTSLEDLGIHTYDEPKPTRKGYHYSLEVITVCKDPEYFEVEKLGDNYYRVRR